MKGFESVFRNRTLLEVGTFPGQLMQRLQDEGKVLDVVSEEVAESNELANLSKIVRRWHVSEQLEFFATGSYAFWCQDEPQVGHLGISKKHFARLILSWCSSNLVRT